MIITIPKRREKYFSPLLRRSPYKQVFIICIKYLFYSCTGTGDDGDDNNNNNSWARNILIKVYYACIFRYTQVRCSCSIFPQTRNTIYCIPIYCIMDKCGLLLQLFEQKSSVDYPMIPPVAAVSCQRAQTKYNNIIILVICPKDYVRVYIKHEFVRVCVFGYTYKYTRTHTLIRPYPASLASSSSK